MEYTHIIHPFPPIYDEQSEILILGTMPSVKSRENDFYYGHSQNRFWQVLASLFGEAVPATAAAKEKLLLKRHIALWDVILSCDIRGSSDSSIRNTEPTDLRQILEFSNVKRIYANGSKAGQLYRKYQMGLTKLPITVLPSTSPANASWTLEKLCAAWQVITGKES